MIINFVGCRSFILFIEFGGLTLLIVCQEGHPACKNLTPATVPVVSYGNLLSSWLG